jgi:ribosomal protein S4E
MLNRSVCLILVATDVITIEKTNEFFRLLYDVKGRFVAHRITKEEAKYKLCRIKKVAVGPKGIPYCITNDGRTIRYPDPNVKANDSVQLDIENVKIMEILKFETGETQPHSHHELPMRMYHRKVKGQVVTLRG